MKLTNNNHYNDGLTDVERENIKNGKKNFNLVKDRFISVSIQIDGCIDDDEEVLSWLANNCNDLYITQKQWNYLTSPFIEKYRYKRKSKTEEPSMEEILASIRRIITEDGGPVILKKDTIWFWNKDDAILFKMVYSPA